MIAARDIVLIGGTVGAVLGGPVRAAAHHRPRPPVRLRRRSWPRPVALLAAVAGGALYAAAARHWGDRPLAPWMILLGAGLPGRLILGGTGLVILGWLGNVTIGARSSTPGPWTTTVVLVALLLARAEADPEQPMQLPVPAAFVIVVLLLVPPPSRPSSRWAR